ncbi:heme biosynthesis HemY N-terminal domain-containing protein [Celerinatantimonas sp. YJH-8]|uniref:heme biosynthesis HemY N-terminal domain-containing protein n=1 Tax=Celerinatantimonas sp. YJH-8 TaxID=3228714 RepID=UPI0038C605A4
MIRLFLLLLVIAAGMIAGPLLEGRQGYVLIAFGHYTIEMSVVSGVSAVIVLYILAQLVTSLIKRLWLGAPQLSRWWKGRRNQNAREQTQQGLLSLYQGDYLDAQQRLTKAAKGSDTPSLNYLSAAKAAAYQGQYKQSDQLLDKADRKSPDSKTRYAIKLTRARLKLEAGDMAAVKELIATLPNDQQHRPAVQQLNFEIARHENDWARQLELLNALLKHQPSRWQTEQARVYRGQFNTLVKQDEAAFERYWKGLPKKLKQQSWLLQSAADALLQANMQEQLLYWLKKALSNPDDIIFELIGKLPQTHSHKLLPQLEQLYRQQTRPTLLLPTLAAICLHAGKLDDAEKYLKENMEHHPTEQTYRLFGDLFAARRDSAQAMHWYRQALQVHPLSQPPITSK